MYSDINSEAYYAVALLNLFICVGIGWLSLCRLNSIMSKKFIRHRIKFTLLLVGAVASGLQPILWATLPDIGSCLLSFSLLLYLLISRNNKRG